MASKSRKRRTSDGGTPPSKKPRETSPVRRSDRAMRGTGGAVEQLRMVGAAVSRDPQLIQKKNNLIAFAGEVRNPMAPETPRRRTKKSGHKTVEQRSSPPRPNTLANGRRIVAEAAAARFQSVRDKRRTFSFEADGECLPGDEEDSDAGRSINRDQEEYYHRGGKGNEREEGEEGEEEGEEGGDIERNDGMRNFGLDTDDPGDERNLGRADDEHIEDEIVNVLDEHHDRNRLPRPPRPADLAALQRQADGHESHDTDDDQSKSRCKRFSKTPKKDRCDDPTQLAFYPPTWKDFLEDCKVETRTYVAVRDPWPANRRAAINGFITESLNMTLVRWKREGRTVDKKIYPEYKDSMLSLLFEDIASWRGEIKKAARISVRAHYDLFPPQDHLSKAATRRYVKAAAENLIRKSTFAHGGKDDEGLTNNFGHPAVRDLLHIFLFSRQNRLGNIRPAEFGERIPNGTLCLAVTAIRCILDGYKMYGKDKFPNFSGDLYRSKWLKFCSLVEELEENDLHGEKFDGLCREIARTGIMGGDHHDESGDTGSDDDYGIVVD